MNIGQWHALLILVTTICIILNSDDEHFYGSGFVTDPVIISEEIAWHGKAQSGQMTLPPLGGLVLKRVKD